MKKLILKRSLQIILFIAVIVGFIFILSKLDSCKRNDISEQNQNQQVYKIKQAIDSTNAAAKKRELAIKKQYCDSIQIVILTKTDIRIKHDTLFDNTMNGYDSGGIPCVEAVKVCRNEVVLLKSENNSLNAGYIAEKTRANDTDSLLKLTEIMFRDCKSYSATIETALVKCQKKTFFDHFQYGPGIGGGYSPNTGRFDVQIGLYLIYSIR